jgi:dynein light intermediate chain, axonemal
MKELEEEKKTLEQSVSELKAKCEAIEKREAERRQMEERKHAEEIAFLKKTNVQLKVFPFNTDPIGRNSFSSKEIKC